VDDLSRSHDVIFLGVGLKTPAQLRIPGENLAGVYDAIHFIERVTSRKWSSVEIGKRVAVIGAGNTAIDAVTEAKRLGAEQVMIIYRRSKEEMSAYEFEYELAKSDGVVFHFLTAPKRILGSTHVEAIECVRMKHGIPDTTGKRIPDAIPNSEFQLPVDMIITAVGQTTERSFLSQIQNLKLEKGNVWVNPETCQTSNPKFFAGGDCVNGGKEVVNAAADGKKAAHGIDNFLISST
jgi:glutamate synthase (NADPH/NADH) small chain